MLRSPFGRGALTLAVGAAGGGVFYLLYLPLPWILGSLAASVLLSRSKRLQPRLPQSWRNYTMVAIGIILGAGFTPDVVATSSTWLFSLIAMSALSVVFAGIAYGVFRRWGAMDRSTALFAAMPGGLAVVAMLAEEYNTQISRVLLCHSARLVVLLVSAPILLQYVSGLDFGASGHDTLAAPPARASMHLGLLTLAAVASWFVASRVNFPSAMMLLPLVVSAVLHGTGAVSVPVPLIMIIATQVVIGSGVAERFSGYRMYEIARDGWLAATVGVAMAVGSLAAAAVVAQVAAIDIAPLFLAYLPGGAPEIGAVALSLSIDPAMVAAHHALRVLLIASVLPVLAIWCVKRRPRP